MERLKPIGMSDCHTHPTFKLRKNCLVKKYDFELERLKPIGMSDCHTHPTFKLRKNCLVKKYDFEYPTLQGVREGIKSPMAMPWAVSSLPPSGRKHQIADNHFIFYRYSLKLRSSFRGSPSLVHRIFIVTPSKR